jgi:hypothetical protein
LYTIVTMVGTKLKTPSIYLVFGFRDDHAPNPSPPFQLESFGRDNISSIIKRYLAPAFAPVVKS